MQLVISWSYFFLRISFFILNSLECQCSIGVRYNVNVLELTYWWGPGWPVGLAWTASFWAAANSAPVISYLYCICVIPLLHGLCFVHLSWSFSLDHCRAISSNLQGTTFTRGIKHCLWLEFFLSYLSLGLSGGELYFCLMLFCCQLIVAFII